MRNKLAFLVLIFVAISGCRANSAKPAQWSEKPDNPAYLVLIAVEASPSYVDGGSTTYGREATIVDRPQWDTHKQLEDMIRVALERQGGEVNIQHLSRDRIEEIEANLAQGVVPEIPGRDSALHKRFITINPERDVVLQGPNVEGDEDYGLVHHCVLFVACFGRPFLNLYADFYDLTFEPRRVHRLQAWHPDRPNDYIEDFDKEAFEKDPAADWEKLKTFFDKYWKTFVGDIELVASGSEAME